MKNVVNSLEISGFVAADAKVNQFATASVARFPLSISYKEKTTEGAPSERKYASMGVEMWRKNENTADFELLKKGAAVTVSGYFKAEVWEDKDGNTNRRVIIVATKVIETPDKEEEDGSSVEEKAD